VWTYPCAWFTEHTMRDDCIKKLNPNNMYGARLTLNIAKSVQYDRG